MGVVFKARQLSMDRIVAIKFLPKKLAQDERIVARFLREARAAGQLAHPNIVSVHELGLADGLHFIAMEYVDGNSIQKKIKDKGPFSEKETLEISVQIAEALKLAHSRGILHRDIKPDNFLIDSMGRVRLADLGLALIQSNPDGALTQDGTTLGTPHFMSPEQCSGTGVDGRSDLYSLGASMFVMVSGRTPYEGSTAASVMVKVLTEPPLPLKKLAPDLSNGFVALVEKLMQKEPTKRFQNAAAAAEAISQCKSGQYKAVAAAKPVVAAKPVATLKSAVAKSPGSPSASKPQGAQAGVGEKPGTRQIKEDDSKLVPLMIGAGAAVLILAVLFFASHGSPPKPREPVAPLAASPAPAKSTTAESHVAPVIPVRQTDDPAPKSADLDPAKHAAMRGQFMDLSNDFSKDKIKPGEAKRRLVEFRKEHDKKLMNMPNAILRTAVNKLENEIDAKMAVIADDWKKLEPKIDADIKDAKIGDALAKLSDFRTAGEGCPEAAKALDRIDALCSGVLAGARKMAAEGKPNDALALLRSVSAKLPEKQDAAIKSAIAFCEDSVKLMQELADSYDRAWHKALYYDPVAKTCFQFADAAKFCADSVSKLRYDANRKDVLELAELFKTADKIVASMRKQVSLKPVELANLTRYSNVSVTLWDDKGLTFVTPQFPQAQLFAWEQREQGLAAEVLLQVAKKLREPDLEKSAGQWDIGVLAFAMGNQNVAAKCLRDAVSGDASFKSQSGVALKLLKNVDLSPVKEKAEKVEKVEKPDASAPPVAPVVASATEDDAKQLFKELQDAAKAGEKKKIDAIRADFDGKFAATEFVKARKKEIDDLTASAKTAAVDPPKAPDKKADTLSPEETAARAMLKAAGWTDIIGTWVWKKELNLFYVEGYGELSNPAPEGDIFVTYTIDDKAAQLRALTCVEKMGADRFLNFGAMKGVGYGVDATYDHAWVYLDYKSKEPARQHDFRWEPRNATHTVNVVHRTNGTIVTVDGVVNKSLGGIGRITGDMHVIVSGPLYLAPKFTPMK